MNPTIINRSLTGLLLAVGIIACLGSPATAGEVHLSAAASLREAVGELADNFAKAHAGVAFTRNFGASDVLARQIENGAPADLLGRAVLLRGRSAPGTCSSAPSPAHSRRGPGWAWNLTAAGSASSPRS